MLDYHLRPATADDAGFLTDVVMEATRDQGRVPSDFDERRWREDFAQSTVDQVLGKVPDSTTSVVEVGNERVGRLRVVRTAEYIELCGIQLRPAYQRRGIGTEIIEDLKAQAAAVGIPLDLGVEKDNPQARKLYERLGFVQVAETGQESRLRWSPRPESRPAS